MERPLREIFDEFGEVNTELLAAEASNADWADNHGF